MLVKTESLDSFFLKLKRKESGAAADTEESVFALPIRGGEARVRRLCLRRGMELNWYEGVLEKPLSFDAEVGYPHLEIAYSLSGGGWEGSCEGSGCTIEPGHSALVYMKDKRVRAQMHPSDNWNHLELRMDLRALDMELPELARLAERSFYGRLVPDRPQLSRLIGQINDCPYRGALGRLYLEGKALELLAYYLGEAFEEPLSDTKLRMSAYDLQCLEKALELLRHNWRRPPSLLELARAVGINDFKLKRAFKERYGTTVFGYVRHLRMNEARRLLESGHYSVSEVSLAVGYRNFSHFAALYKQTFGTTPSRV
ncbi:helix-turn-helix transcriptional regulator [Cohnella hongkongensis]|uniref:Helix-turn-helix transcriptional regulator n=1 Tax=Cohnella hongkongensis TaxID=178337 RepID=A0ABV9F8A3_9BACL